MICQVVFLEDNNSPQILCDNQIIALSVHCCYRRHDSFPYIILLHFVLPQQLCILCIIHHICRTLTLSNHRPPILSIIYLALIWFSFFSIRIPPKSKSSPTHRRTPSSGDVGGVRPGIPFKSRRSDVPSFRKPLQVCTLSFAEARCRNPPFAFTVCPSPSATSSLSTDSNT